MVEIPAWLPSSFSRAIKDLGCTASREEIDETCQRVIDRWNEPERTFHGLSHLVAILKNLEALISEARSPSAVRLAAWYHGISFTRPEDAGTIREPGENEHASARRAHEELLKLGVDDAAATRVATLIAGMASEQPKNWAVIGASPGDNEDTRDIDLMILRDAHLSVLADPPQRYRSYLDNLRREFAFFGNDVYYRVRRNVIRRLLSRKHLFFTPTARQWERSARQNLTAELDRIEGAFPTEPKAQVQAPALPFQAPAQRPAQATTPQPSTSQTGEIPKSLVHEETPGALASLHDRTDRQRRVEVAEETLRKIAESSRAAANEREVREVLQTSIDSPLRDKTLAEETGRIPRIQVPPTDIANDPPAGTSSAASVPEATEHIDARSAQPESPRRDLETAPEFSEPAVVTTLTMQPINPTEPPAKSAEIVPAGNPASVQTDDTEIAPASDTTGTATPSANSLEPERSRANNLSGEQAPLPKAPEHGMEREPDE